MSLTFVLMPRILLIDDDQLLLIALRAAFEQRARPIVVDTASTAEQALRLVQLTDYDTIVSDFNMPGLNGIDFLKECKTTRPDIPIILLTGYGTYELEEEALNQGAYALVQKPVDAEVFVSVVTRGILRREVRRAGFIQGQLFAAENERLSSRLKAIDARLKDQIEEAKKTNPKKTTDPSENV
jgi:two-component system, NtrC family, response regulator AtoC